MAGSEVQISLLPRPPWQRRVTISHHRVGGGSSTIMPLGLIHQKMSARTLFEAELAGEPVYRDLAIVVMLAMVYITKGVAPLSAYRFTLQLLIQELDMELYCEDLGCDGGWPSLNESAICLTAGPTEGLEGAR